MSSATAFAEQIASVAPLEMDLTTESPGETRWKSRDSSAGLIEDRS
jgi:hypothetical protein